MMKRETQLKLFKYLLGLFLICLGIVIGIAIRHYYEISLAETINIIDVATLATTVFLAVYIPGVIDKQMQIKQDKKKLIEERIEELQSLYRRVNMLIQQDGSTTKDKLTIKNTLEILKHRLDTIISLLAFFDVKTSFSDEINGIKSLCTEYYTLLYSKDLELDDFKYTNEVKEKEVILYSKIDKASSLLIFKISDIR